MIKITYPDGSMKQFEAGVTPLEIANGISSSLAKKCIIAKVNNEFHDMKSPILVDSTIELVTGYVDGLTNVLNHSCAH